MSAAWSPSEAREAARAALCRYRRAQPEDTARAEVCVGLLRNDRAFDSAVALCAETWGFAPPEVREHLDRYCRASGIGSYVSLRGLVLERHRRGQRCAAPA